MDNSLSKPLIGLTTYRNFSEQGYPRFAVSEAYTSSLVSAGACPVLIPLGLPDEQVNELLDHLNGVLFTGGGDIAPQQYGQPAHPLIDEIDLDRDNVEIILIEQAIRKGLPFMGICRGLQIINVALGGDLYADILEQHPHALKHQYYPDYPREYLAHEVTIDHSSMMAKVFPHAKVPVNSLHHQGVRNLAPGLKPTAFAPDGIIEAFELSGHPFGLAVQWHPENLQKHQTMRGLFRIFVEASMN
jgi:putative glutamine amidotransferase